MMATAHPDDENNGLLVMLNRGQGYRTALATATRGNGGQNEIGPELFEALGVLRTEELAALHRFDGAEQYFTRAVDFGYSFSIDETFEKWGRDEIIGDYVRLIRTIRPDVITAHDADGDGRGQHGIMRVRRSCRARRSSWPATRRSIPEQIKDGLRPWQPKKFYYRGGLRRRRRRQPARPPARTTRVDLARLRSAARQDLLGDRHRSAQHAQVPGQAQLLALPGPSAGAFQLVESTIAGAMERDERRSSTASTRRSPAWRSSPARAPPKELIDGLAAIATSVQTAQKQFDTEGDEATLQPLLAGLRAVRVLRGQLRDVADRRRRALRDRLPAAAEGARVPAGGRSSPTASASKRSPTTASWCRASR